MKINNVLKSEETKITQKRKSLDDDVKSFSKSLNEFLEKKRISKQKNSKDRLENKGDQEERKIKDKPKDLKEDLSIAYLVQSYPLDKSLNSQEANPSIEELFGEEAFNLEDLLGKIETELLIQGEDREGIEAFLDKFLEENTSFKNEKENFIIQEAKANLLKALNKDASGLEGEKTDLLQRLNLENTLRLESIKDGKKLDKDLELDDGENLAVKSELLSKEEVVEGSKEILLSSKEGKKDPISKVEFLEENKNKNLDLSDSGKAKPIKDVEILDGKGLETLEENISLEEPKLLENNFLFNRIQSSILGLEEADDALSTQNIQTIEDNMIKFMKVSKDGDTSVMKVKLYPEELGSIDISLKLDKGKLIADIVVASDSIKDMFLNSSSALNRNLMEQNIPIKNINISVNDSFNNLKNANDQAGHSGSGNGSRQDQDPRKSNNNFKNNPIDNMRIDTINKENIGKKGLNILV